MKLQAYLDWEDVQLEKHELVQGAIFAMTGGRRPNGRVLANLMRHLGNLLDGTPCQVFADSMKLQVAEDTILYPDVFVTCDKADLATDQIFRAPTLVIEVLSPSTQAYDRSRRFALCRRLASLQEYILVNPETWRVEAFRRSAQNEWVLHDMSDGSLLEAVSIGCQVALADVFFGVEPPAADAAGSAPAALPPGSA
jgi:Uma2 family endonuclease